MTTSLIVSFSSTLLTESFWDFSSVSKHLTFADTLEVEYDFNIGYLVLQVEHHWMPAYSY